MAALFRLARLSAPALLATVSATVLATVLMMVSAAVAVPAPEFRRGTGGPALGAAAAGPSAVAVRSDARVPALRGSHGSDELDLLGSHRHPHRSPDSGAGWPVPAAASGALRGGHARCYQGRAPPHTR